MAQYHARRLRVESLEQRCMLSATVFEHNNIGYFLRATGQLERYDIPQEKWLTPIQLAGAQSGASVGLVDDDGIYVAFGAAVYRYNLDGSGRTPLLDAPQTVSALHSDGNILFVNHTGSLDSLFTSINKTTNTLIATFEHHSDSRNGSSIAPQINKIFGRTIGTSPGDITYLTYSDAGQFVGAGDSPYHGDYIGGPPTWVFPDGAKVVDASGNIYSTSSLTHLNSFAMSVTDIDFVGGVFPVVLSGTTSLTAFTQGTLPTGNATLNRAASEIFVNDQSVLAFSVDGNSATGYSVEIVPLTELSAPQPGEPINPVGLPFTPDKVVVASSGNVLLFSKAHQSVFTWSPVSQTFGNTVPLIGVPDFISYSSATNTIYLAYDSGLIRKIDLDDAEPSEVPFATLPSNPLGLSTAGEFVFATDGSGAWVSHYTFAPDGTQISARDWNYYSTEYVWSQSNRKMYFFRDDTSPNDLFWENIGEDGTIGNSMDSPLHSSDGFQHPIRVAPDGSIVVLGSGVIHDAITLERKTTSLTNAVADIAWVANNIYTIRAIGGLSQLQQWAGSTYALGLVSQLPGDPAALVNLGSDRLLAITIGTGGVPNFHVLNANLQVIPRPAPVANAGVDVSVYVGALTALDGSNSFDPDGAPNPITFQWSASGPGPVTLGTPTAPTTTFLADVAGNYTVQLSVSDGVYTTTDSVVVTVRTNRPPVANPTRSQANAVVGRTVKLDATASTDPDGDALSYVWSVVTSPPGTGPTITNANQPLATLIPNVVGTYTVELKVSDGVHSDTENFTITVAANQPPVANATTSDPTGTAGKRNAILRGTLSSDPDGDALTYQWSVISKPADSNPTIFNSTQSVAFLAANVPGVYTVELAVSDGLLSDTDQFVVTMGVNLAPNADASATQTSVIAGANPAVLDGRRSMDPDGDALSYAWKVVASSNGSIPPITNSTRSVAQLGASTAGVYAIELKVSDGTLSDVDFVIVEIRGNQPPVADVSLSDRIIALGTTARLDGSKSTDPDGDALTYAWRVVATSSGTIPHIENATSAVASLMGQAVGHYAVEFAVRDAVAADIEYLLVNVRENPGLHMGDFNASGIVDQEDYLVWRATFGSTSDLRADANGDKTIDAADSVMWRRHQGQSVAATSAAMSEASAVSAAGDIDAEVAADHNVEDVRLLAAVDSALSLWPTAAALSTFHEPPGPVVTRLQSYLKNDLLLLVTVPAVFEAGDRDPDSDGSRRVDIEDAPPEFDRLFNELGGSYDNLEVS